MSSSQLPQKAKIDKRQAIAELWRRGTLKWKLYPHQLEMYDFIHKTDASIVVIASSRQIGKSTLSTLLAVEECIKNPNSIVKFIAPKVKDIRRIIAPIIRDLTKDAPKDVAPKYNTQDYIYRFPNGSEIQLAGTDNGHAESIRGTKANLCIIDEAGFCDDLNYVVSSVLVPTLTTTGGKIIMISTPSKSPDHPFMDFMAQAEAEGRFIKKTIYDNTMLSKEQIDKIAEAIGGKDSIDFKREYLVEKIISEEDAVVPEFTEELQKKIIFETTRPPFYDAYVSMDIGGRDLTVVLFGFYDYLGARTIIEDELVFNRQVLTDELAYAIKEKEQKLWAHPITGEPHNRILRVADNNNIILLNDLGAKHDIVFIPTAKDNKIAALNNMRLQIKTQKVIINPRCKTLISHLKGAIWNRARTDFARSVDNGHYDACFTPGNRVLTRLGYKNIEDIVVGDEVLTHNNRFRKVTATMNKEYSGVVIKTKLAGQREIISTPEHSFYASKTSNDDLNWTSAENLIGHRVYSPSNNSTLCLEDSLKKENYTGLVYNLEVEEDNSYVVNGAAVHNCSALMYLIRNINFTKNPYPANYSFSGKEHVAFLDQHADLNSFERQLVNKTKSFKLYSRWKKQ